MGRHFGQWCISFDGVCNAQIRKNIARMQQGEQALWRSSTQGKAIYGILEVKTEPFQDPTNPS